MALSIFGKIILIAFLFFMAEMIKQGPFIFQSGKKHFINILDLEFDKKKLNIKTGDTVVWTNKDLIRHSFINDFPDIPNSGMLFPFDKYQHTFNKQGSVQFKSSLYKNMLDMNIHLDKDLKEILITNKYFQTSLTLFLNSSKVYGHILYFTSRKLLFINKVSIIYMIQSLLFIFIICVFIFLLACICDYFDRVNY